MEDWELFFEEKSRRRADKERARARTRTLKTVILVAVVAGVAAGVILFSGG